MVDTVVDGIDIRSAVPEGKETIRQKIVDDIMLILETAPFDVDVPDGADLFDTVVRGGLDDISAYMTPAVAVEEGDERIEELIYQKSDKKLRLYFHVKPVRVQGVDPEPIINYYFHRISQLFVTTTQHLAGFARDCAEVGNSIQTIGSTDTEPGGSIWLDLDYRHDRGDWTAE